MSIDHANEARIAAQALQEGDRKHAMHHAANALFATVGEDTYLTLLHSIAPTIDQIQNLLEGDNSDRLLTAKSVLLHLVGRDHEALPLLAQIANFRRDLAYERWLAPWIASASGTLHAREFANYLLAPTRTNLGRLRLRPAEVRFAARVALVADALLHRQDVGADSTLLSVLSSVYRRAGRLDDAVAAAERSLAVEASFFGYTGLALAERTRRRYDEARAAFEAGAKVDPSAELTVSADLGRIAWEAGDLDDARERFTALSRATPDDPEAKIGAAWLQHVRPATGFGATFKRWTTGDSSGQGATFETQVGRPLLPDDTVLIPQPWIGWLPESNDATINTARQVLEKDIDPSGLRMTVSHLEAPSVRLAMAMLQGSTDLGVVNYSASEVPTPDIRLPRTKVPFVLWTYDDNTPSAGLPAPSEEVRAAVDELARLPFYLPRWWDRAKEAGRRLGPARAEELCAAMVHPTLSSEFTPWVWLQRTQIAAALLVAHVDDGWDSSARRRALVSILEGPLDWVVDAAVVALVQLALDEPDHLPAIRSSLELLWDQKPSSGHVCWAEVFAVTYPRLPDVSQHYIQLCEEWLNPPSEGSDYSH